MVIKYLLLKKAFLILDDMIIRPLREYECEASASSTIRRLLFIKGKTEEA
jgi:hypothetical protein